MGKAKKDFFISHRSNDREWAEWIAWQLESAGYSVVIDVWDFAPGCNFVAEMNRALIECERVIAILSPEYFESVYCEAEWTAAFQEQLHGGTRRLLPVRIVDFDVRGLLAPNSYVDLHGVHEKTARERLLDWIKIGRGKPAVAPGFPKPAPRFPGTLPPIWNIRHPPNPNFTDPYGLIPKLRRQLASGRRAALTQAIHGLGGVGKTQLALEYSHRFAGEYDVVWWVRSEEPAQLASDYAALARDLDLPEKDEPDQPVIVEAVRRRLEQRGKWLIVFDNAPHPKSLEDYSPRGGAGHVIVTSRDPNWSGVAEALPVVVWPPEKSADFLLKRTGRRDRDSALNVAEALGYLPLALEQAAAYMLAAGRSLAEYLAMFREHHQELLKRGKPEGYKAVVATTYQVSLEAVAQDSPAAVDLLNLCAFLSPDDIPRDLLTGYPDELPDSLKGTAGSPIAFDDAVTALRRHSLIEAAGDSISAHRLVQLVLRDGLSADQRRECARTAVSVVNAAFPFDSDDVRTWPTCARLLPHALSAAERAAEAGCEDEQFVRLLNHVGNYLRGRAELVSARDALQRALAAAESIYGPKHGNVAATANNLGMVLKDLGDLKGARKHCERALKIDEAAFGPDHPNVATDVNNLGMVLKDLGDLKGARKHIERALKIFEKSLGPDHPNTVTVRRNLELLLSLGPTN